MKQQKEQKIAKLKEMMVFFEKKRASEQNFNQISKIGSNTNFSPRQM